MSKFSNLTKEELLALAEKQEAELASKKYGLVWDAEREPEQVVLDCQHHLPVLKRVKGKDIKTILDQGDNILIEGDNYHALTTLNYTHQGKIDVIYIDPPYNTGNQDFKYNDKFVDKEDGFRHSKWLNFMEKRLRLAKDLLSEKGVIFISIDDNEQAQLKMLLNSIFGEDNFVANIAVEMSLTQGMKVGSAQNGKIVKNGEYILIYGKQPNWLALNVLYDGVFGYDKHFSIYLDQNKKELKIIPIADWLKLENSLKRYFERYQMESSFKSFCKLIEIDNEFQKEIYDKYSENIYQSMMASINIPDEIKLKLSNGEVVKYQKYILHQVDSGKIRQLLPLSATLGKTDDYESFFGRRRIRGDFWKGFYSDMMNLAKEGGVEFKNGKKPVRLIKQIIKMSTNRTGFILDFFAGSGTTGHAVLDLNKEDGGNRRFILCTNNENNICEDVTYPRLQKVIKGYKKNGDGEKVEGLGGNLQYFKTDLIKKTGNKDQMRINLTQKCTDMLCVKENIFNLETEHDDYKIFSSNQKDQFLCVYYNFYDESFDEFLKEVKKLKGHKKIYMFSMDGKVDKKLFAGISDFDLEEIPQKIIDIYKQLVKMNIPVKAETIFLDFEKAHKKIFEDQEKDEGARVLRIVLEKTLQKIAQKNGISILDDKGKEQKIALLNDQLKDAKIISKVVWEENKTYLAIGNHASHGDYDEYDLKKVENFYKHIQELHNIFGI